ncbi:hypothetical protein [Natronincola ferrireducens]|uniref:Uncharacterized protein n=1 Tax=Natronincola ferrireducens TaxID=393762 RepID=A0A1G9GY00_9FIRM|nr:hypothetical protein [Natronincola ferrireducens]SDL05590.1 hypothetical protein SAMN05660472_02525 [Natronincola ferrireducens]
MTTKRPKGVTFIGYFYIFGAIALLLSLVLGTKQDVPIGLRFGMPHVPENVIVPFIVVLSLVISYGYLTLKKWGYWLMILYSLLFLLISLSLLIEYNTQPFIGNTIWSIFVIIYTSRKKKAFLK